MSKKNNNSSIKISASAGAGSGHWWHQRLSAIILVLLTLFLFRTAYFIGVSDYSQISIFLRKPCNVLIFTSFVLVSFWHAALGMQVVIEDYVHCRAARLALLLSVQIVSFFTALGFFTAAIYIMTL